MLMLWHPGQTPGRVQQTTGGDQSLDKDTFSSKDIDKTIAWSGHIVMLYVVLKSKRNVNIAVDTGEVERRPGRSGRSSWGHRRRTRIFEVPCDVGRLKFAIKYINGPVMKVCWIKGG